MVGAILLESAIFDKIIQIQVVMWNNISVRTKNCQEYNSRRFFPKITHDLLIEHFGIINYGHVKPFFPNCGYYVDNHIDYANLKHGSCLRYDGPRYCRTKGGKC